MRDGAVSVIAWAGRGKTSSVKAMAPVANDMIAVLRMGLLQACDAKFDGRAGRRQQRADHNR